MSLSPLASRLSPLASRLSPLASRLSPLASRYSLLGVLAIIAITGCDAGSVVDPRGGGTGLTPPAPSAELQRGMSEIGCLPAARTGRNDVTVPLWDGGVASFDCTGVAQAEIREAVTRYTSSNNPTADQRFPAMQTWYVNVTVHYQCEVTHHWNYVPAMGEYVYAYSTVDGCWITEIHYSSGGGGGGGGAGSWETDTGDPTPAPSPPESPPIVADTICTDSTADRVLLFQGGRTPIPMQGPLNDLAILDSLRAAHFDSYGTIANPLPQSQRVEIGGIIYQAVEDGPYLFHRVPSTQPSRCSYSMDTSQLPQPRFRDIATFHTHPMRDDEEFTCPGRGDTVFTAASEYFGGGGPEDWNYATISGRPLYTIDPDRIWRLEPDTPVTEQKHNPQRWMKTSSGTCAPHAAF